MRKHLFSDVAISVKMKRTTWLLSVVIIRQKKMSTPLPGSLTTGDKPG